MTGHSRAARRRGRGLGGQGPAATVHGVCAGARDEAAAGALGGAAGGRSLALRMCGHLVQRLFANFLIELCFAFLLLSYVYSLYILDINPI